MKAVLDQLSSAVPPTLEYIFPRSFNEIFQWHMKK